MPLCVFCGASVSQLYKSYGAGSISLTLCKTCHRVADPFVEYDWVLRVLDLALLKPPMFKHLLCNEKVDKVLLGRFLAFLFIVDCFVRINRLNYAAAPLDVLYIGALCYFLWNGRVFFVFLFFGFFSFSIWVWIAMFSVQCYCIFGHFAGRKKD